MPFPETLYGAARGAAPAEVANAYVYLMLNGYAKGQILPVEGGGLLV